MPQPIDPQTELARVSAAERIQEIAGRASLAQQMRQAAAAVQQSAADLQQVYQPRAKGEQVESETRRNAPFVGRRRRKAKEGPVPETTIYTSHERIETLGEEEARRIDLEA
jgi:hypothetical protein